MRVLLVGEYSGFHNALKSGLEKLGHEVVLLGDGDGFKSYPVDIQIGTSFFRKTKLRKKLLVGVYKLFGIQLEDVVRRYRFRESVKNLPAFDHVQFINSNALQNSPKLERKMMEKLIRMAPSSSLVVCGDDVPYINYLLNKHEGYSILTPIHEGSAKISDYHHTYQYTKAEWIENYNWLSSHVGAIIPTHIDFKMAMNGEPRATAMIPCPVQMHHLELTQNNDLSVIEVFIGINKPNYYKKGIHYFEQALQIVQKKYPKKVRVTRAINLPYDQYIKSYRNCHILLDQALSYDQGYNSLEAMAMGKLVFAGAGAPFLEHYELDEAPLVDATPDIGKMVEQLSYYIEQPEKILEMGLKARTFIKTHHDSINVAQQYLNIFKQLPT